MYKIMKGRGRDRKGRVINEETFSADHPVRSEADWQTYKSQKVQEAQDREKQTRIDASLRGEFGGLDRIAEAAASEDPLERKRLRDKVAEIRAREA